MRRRQTAAEVLARFIESRGLKTTRQRNLILEAFLEAKGHVSVEALLSEVRAADPRISTATIYRTMKLLTECGLAHAQQFGDGQTRYEHTAGVAHHDHMICTGCSQIIEFEDPRIERLQASIASAHGFQLTRHKMELYGLCSACQRAERATPAAGGVSES